MSITIYDEIKQGTDEWLALRLGKPTASKAASIVTNKGAASSQQQAYATALVAERLTGKAEHVRQTRAMGHGHKMEPEARDIYALKTALTTGDDVTEAAFVWNDEIGAGCSPDGLVGQAGGIEIKCPKTATFIDWCTRPDQIPSEYLGQVHFSMAVTGRRWWDFMAYDPRLEAGRNTLTIRAEWDGFTNSVYLRAKVFAAKVDALERMMIERGDR